MSKERIAELESWRGHVLDRLHSSVAIIRNERVNEANRRAELAKIDSELKALKEAYR